MQMKLKFHSSKKILGRFQLAVAQYKQKKRVRELKSMFLGKKFDPEKDGKKLDLIADFDSFCRLRGSFSRDSDIFKSILWRSVLVLEIKKVAGEDIFAYVNFLLPDLCSWVNNEISVRGKKFVVMDAKFEELIKSFISDDVHTLRMLHELSLIFGGDTKSPRATAAKQLMRWALLENDNTRSAAIAVLGSCITGIPGDQVFKDAFEVLTDATEKSPEVAVYATILVQRTLNSTEFQKETARNSLRYEWQIVYLANIMLIAKETMDGVKVEVTG